MNISNKPSERSERANGVQTRRKGPNPFRPCAANIIIGVPAGPHRAADGRMLGGAVARPVFGGFPRCLHRVPTVAREARSWLPTKRWNRR